mmetsp:Transcript_45532/g.114153  ORF Transcript_45532/g.114153 Transcript_45532/m.114153 type:complete len:217 (+) Transcript_45532:3215-3865(+)
MLWLPDQHPHRLLARARHALPRRRVHRVPGVRPPDVLPAGLDDDHARGRRHLPHPDGHVGRAAAGPDGDALRRAAQVPRPGAPPPRGRQEGRGGEDGAGGPGDHRRVPRGRALPPQDDGPHLPPRRLPRAKVRGVLPVAPRRHVAQRAVLQRPPGARVRPVPARLGAELGGVHGVRGHVERRQDRRLHDRGHRGPHRLVHGVLDRLPGARAGGHCD